jgi:anti-sigma factor RsiW
MAVLTSGPSCQEMVELVTDYLEGSLGWRDRRRVARHLAACAACTRYVEQMRETLSLLGTVPVDTLSPEAQATLLDAFRDRA